MFSFVDKTHHLPSIPCRFLCFIRTLGVLVRINKIRRRHSGNGRVQLYVQAPNSIFILRCCKIPFRSRSSSCSNPPHREPIVFKMFAFFIFTQPPRLAWWSCVVFTCHDDVDDGFCTTLSLTTNKFSSIFVVVVVFVCCCTQTDRPATFSEEEAIFIFYHYHTIIGLLLPNSMSGIKFMETSCDGIMASRISGFYILVMRRSFFHSCSCSLRQSCGEDCNVRV